MPLNNNEISLDLVWLGVGQFVDSNDIETLTGATQSEIQELIDYDVLVPANLQNTPWQFSADCIFVVNQACRLRHEMHLEAHELAITLALLDRIRRLEAALALATAQQPIFRRG